MTSRLRLVLLVLAPILVATGVILGWAGWTVSQDHASMGTLAARASGEKAVTDANSRLVQKVQYAIVRGRVPDTALPPALRTWADSARTMLSSPQILGYYSQADRVGAGLLPRLEAAGFEVTPPVRAALARWTAEQRAAVEGGRAASVLPWDDYASAINTLQTDYLTARDAGAAAIQEIARRAAEPSPWRQPAFLAFAFGLGALAIACAFAIAWMIGRRVARAEADRDAAHARASALEHTNRRLEHTVGASRRLTSGSDLGSVSHSVAEETRELIGAETAVVFLVDDLGTSALPVAVSGPAVPAVIPAGAGLVGRAMDSAMAARSVTVGDPAFPDADGPLTLVAAPLVAGRRVTGAVVVATAGDHLASEEDQTLLQLIALPAATAIEAARAHDSTERMAHTDALTGVANRRQLDGDLAGLDERADAVGFLMIDVDHFKAYNDAHGHPAGDALLRDVATLIRANVRDGDVVYRFGGEEFAVLLPGAGAEAAAEVGTRVRAAVAAHDFPGGGTQPEGRVTVSVGVSRHASGTDPEGLVAQADGALYQAKRGGRDRVVVAGPAIASLPDPTL